VEGYTARDALIVMRMDLTDSLHEIEQEISDLVETLEFTGIAGQLLRDDFGTLQVDQYPAIRRWLETVSNESDLKRDLDELTAERDELLSALAHLEDRLTGRGS
jgi:chromosome segregation ATPase